MKNFISSLVMLVAIMSAVSAQTGGITGKITNNDGAAVSALTVRVLHQKLRATTNIGGIYSVVKIPKGEQTIVFSGLGYKQITKKITVKSGETLTLNVELENGDIPMSEVTVYGAARRMQKITEAPAAISVVLASDIERAGSHGQLAKTLEHFPGVDVVQSGMNDFNVNTRGFNTSINRRVLVLLDGRDPSIPSLNLMEWNSLQTNLSDVSKIEVVRGPGSALFGANAYNGVINITSSSPREVLGTRISLTGGEYQTFRGNIRHAGEIDENWSYKLTANYSRQKQAWVTSRDTVSTHATFGRLEYLGIAPDVTGYRTGIGNIQNIDSLIKENDVATNLSGTARIDYNFSPDESITAEIGGSRYGGEYFVNTTGRILINDIEKPFVRLTYNSKNWNIQTHWNRRNTITPQIVMNAATTSGDRSDATVIDAQWNDVFLEGTFQAILGASHEYQHVFTAVSGSTAFLSPDNLHNNNSGVYGQIEYAVLPTLQIIGAARIDRSTLFETQFSPKGGIVFTPIDGHTLRATVNRSFLRPSYSDLYRRSVVGLPVNIAATSLAIDSVLSARNGQPVQMNLGLGTPILQLSLGNTTVTPEEALSLELGYKGVITPQFYVTTDIYYNRRKNFISQPLPNLAPNVYVPFRANSGNSTNDSVANAMISAALGTRYNRLAIDLVTQRPSLIVAPANIGLINEMGLEIGANYSITREVSVSGNFAYLHTEDVENAVSAQKIAPNTSPRRYNFGIDYRLPNQYDASVQLRYVDGFTWVAGTFEGYVPAYTVVNINAGYHFTKDLRLGVNVFNLLDRKHYQIFGGTILRRYSTAEVSYTIP